MQLPTSLIGNLHLPRHWADDASEIAMRSSQLVEEEPQVDCDGHRQDTLY